MTPRQQLSATMLSRREKLYEAIDRRLPYLLIAPAVFLVAGLLLYPIVWAVRLSLYEVSTTNLSSQTFVGLGHYFEIFTTPVFHQVMWNSFVFVGASVIGQLGIGITLALLLDRVAIRTGLARVFRATYILPWATTGVIVAYSWQFMFEPRVGLVNEGLRWIGIANPPVWLSSVEWAMVAVVIANIWRGVPFSFVFQTSGLQSIHRSLYEAADVGGASPLQTIRYVTIPLLHPFVVMNLILITIFTFNVFDIIFVMTGGGPLEATEVLAIYMYESAFEIGTFGRASALAVVLFAINLVMAILYLTVLGTGWRGSW